MVIIMEDKLVSNEDIDAFISTFYAAVHDKPDAMKPLIELIAQLVDIFRVDWLRKKTDDNKPEGEAKLSFSPQIYKKNGGRINEFKKCKKCHTGLYLGLETDVEFCPRCGSHNLATWRETVTCSNDPSHRIYSYWEYCGVCGAKIVTKTEKVS